MQKVRIGLAAIVSAVWLAGYYLAFKNHTQTPTELSGLEALVLGWAFAGTVRDQIKRKDDDD